MGVLPLHGAPGSDQVAGREIARGIVAAGSRLVSAVTRHRTALIVDDNRGVRTLLGRLLGAAGYSTHEAANAIEAEALAESLEALDLVITDVRLPGTGGLTLTRTVETRFPDVAVLFISGEPDDDVERETRSHARRSFLAKPFTTDTLWTAVRLLIDRS